MGGEFSRIVLEDGGMMGKSMRVGSGEGRFCGTFFFQCGHWREGSMYPLCGLYPFNGIVWWGEEMVLFNSCGICTGGIRSAASGDEGLLLIWEEMVDQLMMDEGRLGLVSLSEDRISTS